MGKVFNEAGDFNCTEVAGFGAVVVPDFRKICIPDFGQRFAQSSQVFIGYVFDCCVTGGVACELLCVIIALADLDFGGTVVVCRYGLQTFLGVVFIGVCHDILLCVVACLADLCNKIGSFVTAVSKSKFVMPNKVDSGDFSGFLVVFQLKFVFVFVFFTKDFYRFVHSRNFCKGQMTGVLSAVDVFYLECDGIFFQVV